LILQKLCQSPDLIDAFHSICKWVPINPIHAESD
jgi:hypothetical protein